MANKGKIIYSFIKGKCMLHIIILFQKSHSFILIKIKQRILYANVITLGKFIYANYKIIRHVFL